MAYVYRHIRLDKNEPFYIGISNSKIDFDRANSIKNRNNHWNNIVKITDYRVEIVLQNLTWNEACKKEIELINLYKKSFNKGTLCNIADGGQGGFISFESNQKRIKSLMGHKVTDETKEKIRNKAKNRIVSDFTKLKMSLKHKSINTGHWLDNKGEKNPKAFKVNQYSKDLLFIKTWECAKYAIDNYKLNSTAITDCLKGRQKSAGGYIWKKYENEINL
jgi:hypothetical protein